MPTVLQYAAAGSPPTQITLPDPFQVDIDAGPPGTFNLSLQGQSERILIPRIDLHVRVAWNIITAEMVTDLDALRIDLENWWQWARSGNDWKLILNNSTAVETTLVDGSPAQIYSAGSTLVNVVSATDIQAGSIYAILAGPSYQLVSVASVGSPDTEIHLTQPLIFDFPGGALFRDRYLWNGIIRDPEQKSPIEDQQGKNFGLVLDFFEKCHQA